ncbi:bifunctional proline dehydrogenase/L-glutamate gamma-semialdehyde dehydrogenase PutA [Albimonas sp. CAU 1670]|uniref:bifunctional proline dehydrogenase/L-glutamate gamma-semialdehyde dehydrogenase PutA n=1 Tax=Albimonas sp. CAU 1670 TaxID=3032599 RepID=UPI0023DA7173|nr:bifunctional proline dehydrogenase/L-glutamate gamma-semialdehyde dehydrogenase PutA [Albimonas sp. CAU 1670]MDF2234431.1 bifunctional proline dehydrogenase/L-glutamate gamma-semialdehyde dehydrogenase PutA [Albimonas sp. CAU 1670]
MTPRVETHPDPWTLIEGAKRRPEAPLLAELEAAADLSPSARAAAVARAAGWVRAVRADDRPGLTESMLAEYGLSTEEGVSLMCLAEALLRVPDAETIDALIEDKIAPSDWGRHLGRSASSLVNASTWALLLTGRVLDDKAPGVAGRLRGAIKRLGEPVIRTAVAAAMRELGRQFVLGETIHSAMDRARGMEAKGYAYSYDMLGEAAMTAADAARYARSYADAIAAIGARASHGDVRRNPGISVKLSALHPRYEVAQEARVMAELVPALSALARQAAAANISLAIDAEEQDRLALSLKVIERVLEDPALADWQGFGVVVQAYGRRALPVVEWLHALATRLDRRITLRLVKGAYWDGEIKHAQVEGLEDFPVFTRKAASDVSYLGIARRLLGMTDRIFPQFATHNAHTLAAVLEMAGDLPRDAFEVQRLHGMGEALHARVKAEAGTGCRIYAPVGAHRDLLAYLVRRLLENGANSSFVNRIMDASVSPEAVAACPFEALAAAPVPNPRLPTGPHIFDPRRNSAGADLTDAPDLAALEAERTAALAGEPPVAAPILAVEAQGRAPVPVISPATGERVGEVIDAAPEDVEAALAAARPWDAPPETRAAVLRRAADLYEAERGPILAILAREAGKTIPDAIGEIREAVDFLRYYADQAETDLPGAPRGVFACISPWNFPLAIFTGQVSAALAAGNAVLAKPAEQTPLIAHLAVQLMRRAGVPSDALQFVPGDGETVGVALTSDARVDGVAFTGATETAQAIRRVMAENLAPGAPLIAETGGLNAMIVDTTALTEQAVRDAVNSAFRSAGQRCSALRCLYVQKEAEGRLVSMLKGAMDELTIGDPWALATDVGPLIDAQAREGIAAHVEDARAEGRLLHETRLPTEAAAQGHFLAPTLIRVDGIADIEREVFGPVLHVATFEGDELDAAIDAINARGYGLTFGLHTRIDGRVQHVAERVRAGNLYVNRNQIGAIVGSQPFGGEGLSGTGPKAGGPRYLARFRALPAPPVEAPGAAATAPLAASVVQERLARTGGAGALIEAQSLPGPTGESNRLARIARAPLLCLGPGAAAAAAQARAVRALGGISAEAPEGVAPETLTGLTGFSGALWWGDAQTGRAFARALAARPGPILPLIAEAPDAGHAALERHLCVDTTAAGGNASLLAAAEEQAPAA